MRKIVLIFSIFVLIVSCGEVKKTEQKEQDKEQVLEEDVDVLEAPEDLDTITNLEPKDGILDPTKDVLVVFKEDADVIETKRMIESKGLKLEKEWISDKNSLKIGIIHVPANEKQVWLNKLIESGRFTDVKLYSEENLKNLLKDRKVKSKK